MIKFWSGIRFRKGRSRNPHDSLGASEGERVGEGVAAAEERVRGGEAPAADDCCPICFGSFIVPCRGPCGHWYCADCILQYWNHGAALQPCKCPMCSQKITTLILDASLGHCQDGKLLENVQKYNRLFVGGTRGLIMKVSESPLLIKRIIHEMMDPDAADNPLFKARLFAIFLGALYTVSPLDFLPTGSRLDIVDMCDYFAIGLVTILYVVGLYRRRQRLQHVRQLVAVQPDTI